MMSTVPPAPLDAITEAIGQARAAILDRSATACEPVADRDAPVYRLPAPIAADFSLDGAFTTDDFIAYFKEIAPRSTYFSGQNFSLSEMFDLAKSMQLSPYEVEGNLAASAPCLLEHLTSGVPRDQISQVVHFYEDGQTPKSIITHIGAVQSFHYRSALHFDAAGKLTTSSLDIYLPNSTRVYSRSQSEYNRTGQLSSYSTWIYDGAGEVRRYSITAIFPNVSRVFQSTDVTYYDGPGEPTIRQIHYYDRDGVRLARNEFVFEQGRATLRTMTEFDTEGQVTNETVERNESGFLGNDAGGFSQLGYYTRAHDVYRSTLERLAPAYTEVLRMNIPASFPRLGHITRAAVLNLRETQRYANLRTYYYVALDLAQAMQNDTVLSLYEKYSNVIDVETGHWQPWFVAFMEQERLTPLFEPLQIATPPQQLANSQIASLTSHYLESIGANPTSYFGDLSRNPAAHVLEVLESMRRVKVQIRLLELRAGDETPVMDRMAVTDKPDLSPLGIDKFKLLTGHYFFEVGPDGSYNRDRVSESIIQRRVEHKLTDEDMFYAMNLEHWPLDGSPAEIQESLAKLKEAADLIHKYNPNLMIGYYRLMPRRDLNSAYQGEHSPAYVEWQARNDLMARTLEDSIDILFPSVYVLHLGEGDQTTEERWVEYVRENLREARRVANGKPLIAFTALYYHPNDTYNLKGWDWLEPELVLYQLLHLRSRVDGIVLYSDLPTTWRTLEDHGTVEAFAIFERAKQLGIDNELEAFYGRLLTQHHDELLEKLELEKNLELLRIDRQAAEVRGDSATARRIATQIRSTQQQISGKISIWSEIQAFMQRAEA